MLIMEKNNIG